MVDHLTEYLSTAQVGITLTSLILGWLGEGFIAGLIISSGLLPAEIAHSFASIAAILISPLFTRCLQIWCLKYCD
ncbi:Uncharacterised protein [Weissella viridescens]|uniref:Uncharacterized protein n=1 Tax=Weissella viridescens TaxID=1629 RepID=A0A380P8V3_WEIVI|nr:Uncharacterised protein [Weissella viridescens]